MAKRFEGKRVFITGASSGIGAAVAVELARQGARVALAARREDRLEQVREKIEDLGGEALAVLCDVTDRNSLDAAVARTVEVFGGIDIAYANAGFGVGRVFARLSTEDFRRQFDTNFFGALDTIYAVLPHLRASKGQLVITSSILGHMGSAAVSAYCASKFALCGLAESIYYEFAREGIAVTCINPGIIETEIRSVDNRGVFHPGHDDPAPKWLRVPAEKAAREIVRAIRKRKFEATITGHGKAMVFMGRHFPRLFRAVSLETGKRKLAALEKRRRVKKS